MAEYLCERSYYTFFDDQGVQHSAIMVLQPRSLQLGTTAWHCHAATELAFDTLKEMGHSGISINFCCFDRAKMSALNSLLEARHSLWARFHSRANPRSVQPLLNWQVATGCALHDASKALEWSLSPHVPDPSLWKDLHICIESCRNGFDLLVDHLPIFIQRYMQRRPEAYDREAAAEWWRCVGAAGEWIDMLVDVNPFWHAGVLRVSETLSDGKPVTADLVGDCLLYIVQLKKFCESRWMTVGTACRGLVGALSVGLKEWVDLTLQLKPSVDHKLNGFARLSDEVKWYAAVASVAAFLPEAFSLELAEDDRVLRNLDSLEEVALSELDWIANISHHVWHRLSLVAKSHLYQSQMRDACLDAAQTALGFIAHRVFSTARSLPWSLAIGDIDVNLNDLARGEDTVTDPTALKIIRLMELGI